MTAEPTAESANQARTVWVLGNGQLGAMLRLAGEPINVTVKPIGIDSQDVPVLAAEDLITAEQELWPDTPATAALSAHPNFVNGDVFPRLADRLTQKQLLDSLSIPTAPWLPITRETVISDVFAQLGNLGNQVLLKQRRGGYDGKGQHWLSQVTEFPGTQTIPDDWREVSIAESGIAFDEELSVVGVRNAKGVFRAYPLSLNKHVNGVLTATVANLPRLSQYQAKAEAMLKKLMDALDYRGVMAMECFRVSDALLVNELAPRVHNSGHWTQAGAAICQFEAHLRGIANLPLPVLSGKATGVMINLLGTPWDDRWLSIPDAEVHWYHKAVRPGRKLGHINFTAAMAESGGKPLQESLSSLSGLLPAHYADVITWVNDALAQGK